MLNPIPATLGDKFSGQLLLEAEFWSLMYRRRHSTIAPAMPDFAQEESKRG